MREEVQREPLPVEAIRELEGVVGEIIGRERLVVIAGQPGSGKTILAASLCFASIQRGYKCLYIGLQEPKEKFYEEVKQVGIELDKFEEAGLFRFIKLPVITDETSVEQFINMVSNELISFKPGILVVDSITPILKTIQASIKIRSYLQNYFYELSKLIKGPVVLIVELPHTGERLNLGDIEYVSDVIITLRHRVEHGLISRYMEITKTRGHPLYLAEIPFTIGSRIGSRLLIPPLLHEVIEPLEYIETPCNNLSRAIPHIPRSAVIYYEYPPHYRVPEPGWALILLGVYASKFEKPVVIISYKYPENAFRASYESVISRYVTNRDVVRKIQENTVVKSINPYAYSLTELNFIENTLVEEYNPAVVIIQGVGELMGSTRDLEKYVHLLQNQLLYFKGKGIMTIRLGSRIRPIVSRINASLSDIVFKAKLVNDVDYKLYVWSRFAHPQVLGRSEVEACIGELADKITRIANNTDK